MYKSLDELYTIKKKVEAKPIFKRYKYALEISSKGNKSLINEVLEYPVVRRYVSACKVLEVYKNAFDDKFDSRYEEFYKMNLLSGGINLSNTCFSDGLCVRNWLEAVWSCYKNKEVDDDLYNKLKELYLGFYDKSKNKLAYLVRSLFFATKMDYLEVASIFDVKEYVVKNLLRESYVLNPVLGQYILASLKSLDLDEYDHRQQVVIGELIVYISSLDLQKKVVYKEVKVVDDPVDEKVYTYRFGELKKLIIKNELSNIGPNLKFSDGLFIATWWSKVNAMVNNGSEHYDFLLSYVSDIKMELQSNEKKLKTLNPKSSYDYGTCLYNVAICFGLNSDKLLFEKIGIPSSLLHKIFNNELYPSMEMIEMFNEWLSKLVPSNNKQTVVLKQAIELCENMMEEAKSVEPDKGSSFTIFSLDKLDLYLENFSFDTKIMDIVKKQNLDWYYKCISYHYNVNVLGDGKCYSDVYFYDGTVMMKWIQTQKRTLAGTKNGLKLSKEQIEMVNYVLYVRSEHKVKEDISDVVKKYFDEYYSIFKENIDAGERKIDSVRVHGYYLEEIWKYINNQLHIKNTILTVEQIKKYKELRRNYVSLNRENNKNCGFILIDFGYEMAYFLDIMGWTRDKFSEMMECSRSNFSFYSSNYSRPSEEMVESFVEKLRQLDKTQFRDDQIEDIENFIKVLRSLSKEREKRRESVINFSILEDPDIKNVIYGETRDVYDDVPSEYLLSVEKNDPEWFDKFIRMVDLLNDREALDNRIKVSAYRSQWFLKYQRNVKSGSVSLDKKILLGYLAKLSKDNGAYVDYSILMDKCDVIEEYILKNGVLPEVNDQNRFSDGTCMRHFFVSMRDMYFGYEPDRYKYCDESAYEKIKELAQVGFVATRRLSKPDRIVDSKMYLGGRLGLLRISLGMSKPMFAEFLGLSEELMYDIYANRIPLSEKVIKVLNDKLTNVDYFSLREDQIVDIAELLNVINNKVLTEVSLTKKFINS